MNGGAVSEERSPEKEAIDLRKLDQEPLLEAGILLCGSLEDMAVGWRFGGLKTGGRQERRRTDNNTE
jgi:hypothetical protein